MKTTIISLLLAVLCLHANPAAAQQPAEPAHYTVYSYMKVAPNMHDDYVAMEKAWKKIHIARKKAGMLDDWSLSTVLMPSGEDVEYNYVTRNALVGEAQLAEHFEGSYFPKNWESLLTPDELKLVNRTDEIRSLVKSEVWMEIDRTVATDMGNTKIAVFNYFDYPEGKSGDDHVKMELDIWKPVHAARVKDGSMKGWVLLDMVMPFGDDMPYHQATIDLYTDMGQYMTPWFDKYFAKAHPGKNVDELLKQTDVNADLLKGDVRMIIDRLDW